MEHEQARSDGAAERYLLGEMSDRERELFEQHLFDCRECAQEVRIGEMLRANLRAVAVGEKTSKVVQLPRRRFWTRPAWAIAAALLLVVLPVTVYHSVVVLPLQSRLAAAESPRVYSSTPPFSVVRGDGNVLRVGPEERDVGIPIEVPSEAEFERYLVKIESDAVALTLQTPAPPPGVPIEILIPASKVVTGDYRLVLSGLSNGEPIEVHTFNFRIQK